MQNLAIDEIFCVMEFLPIPDLSNSLMVCKEWNGLDQFEPFWKTILQHYLSSNIVEQYRRMVDVHNFDVKSWDEMKVKKVLASGDMKERLALISFLRSFKTRNRSKICMTDKSLLCGYLTSYEVHILKDKTAKRESFRKYVHDESEVEETDEEKRPSILGKRFKYLMEKQVYSTRSIIVSNFFNSYHYQIEFIIFPMLSSFLGIELESEKHSKEEHQFGKRALSLFFKFYEQLDAEKYWITIFNSSIMFFPDYVQVEICEEFLKKFSQIKFKSTIPISVIENVLLNDYFDPVLPLIEKIFETQGVDGYMADFVIHGCLAPPVDELKVAQKVARYFKFLEKFKSRESISEYYLPRFILHSINELSDEYSDELFNLYPIDLNSISIVDCEANCGIKKLLKIANTRGIEYSIERIEEYFKVRTHYSTSSFHTIKYMMEHFNLDILEIQKRTNFFSNYLQALQYYNNFIELHEIIFTGDTEWKILGEVNNNIEDIKYELFELVRSLCATDKSEEILSYLKYHFKPYIFDMDLLCSIVRNISDTHRILLYNYTMISEQEYLSDFVNRQIMLDDSWANFTDTNFESYAKTDPEHAIALYRFIHQ